MPNIATPVKIDSRIAVLLTVIGFVVALTGVAFLLVSAFTQAVVMVALGLAMTRFGYRSIDG